MKFRSKFSAVLMFFFLTSLVGCKTQDEKGQNISNKYVELIKNYQNNQLFVVANNIVFPFWEEWKNRGPYDHIFSLHNYKDIVNEKRKEYTEQFRTNPDDSIRVEPASARFSISRTFTKDGLIPKKYNYKKESYFIFYIQDGALKRGIMPYSSQIDWVDLTNKQIRLKNGFVGKVFMPNFIDSFKQNLSNIKVKVEIWEPHEAFGRTNYKSIVKEESILKLDINQIDYLFFGYAAVDSFANSQGKKLKIDAKDPFIFRLVYNLTSK